MSKRLIFALFLLGQFSLSGQVLGLLKYGGGGDWYANPTALKNLSVFYNATTGAKTTVAPNEFTLEDILVSGVSFLHATGHGRIVFDEKERQILNDFVKRGGFLHIDDNYGMKVFAESELDECFPQAKKVNVANNHPIFNTLFELDGLPKIHEHDNEQPKAIGYFINGELIAILTVESDIGDGWEDPQVHNDPKEKRDKALKMGANLVHWAIVRH
tara:strand:- start:550 stop:1194 length:645 start_codon:yes stop_codon:yes gene_type:complete